MSETMNYVNDLIFGGDTERKSLTAGDVGEGCATVTHHVSDVAPELDFVQKLFLPAAPREAMLAKWDDPLTAPTREEKAVAAFAKFAKSCPGEHTEEIALARDLIGEIFASIREAA